MQRSASEVTMKSHMRPQCSGICKGPTTLRHIQEGPGQKRCTLATVILVPASLSLLPPPSLSALSPTLVSASPIPTGCTRRISKRIRRLVRILRQRSSKSIRGSLRILSQELAVKASSGADRPPPARERRTGSHEQKKMRASSHGEAAAAASGEKGIRG